MKILYHHRTASKDGQDVHITSMVGALRDAGHDVRIVGPTSPDAALGDVSPGVTGLRDRLPKALYEALEAGYCLVDFVKVALAMAMWRPDVLYERYNLFLPSGLWAKRLFRVPMILEINAPLLEERSRHSGLHFQRLAGWSERVVWRGADHVLPVTDVLGNIVSGAGVPSERMTIIPNGVDTDVFSPRARDPELAARHGLGNRTVVGFTGFAREWHGLDRVLRTLAAAGNLDWHLLIVGDGPALEPLRRLAVELSIEDRLSLTGVVEREAIPAHLSLVDIAVQPDVVEYASPLKLFEYMAAGKAILAVDRPNIREILVNDVNAVLFPPGDEIVFARELERLCRSEQLRERLGKEAAASIERRSLKWSANAAQVVDIAAELRVR